MWVALIVACGSEEEDSGVDPAARLPPYGGCVLSMDYGKYYGEDFRSLYVQVITVDEEERVATVFVEDDGDIYGETYTWADDRCWTSYGYAEYEGYEEYDQAEPYEGLEIVARCDEFGFTTEESWRYWGGDETWATYTMAATNESRDGRVTRRTLDWTSDGGSFVERQAYDWVGDEMAGYDQYLENNWVYHEASEFDADGNRTWGLAQVPGNSAYYFRWTYDELGRMLSRELAENAKFSPLVFTDTLTWDEDRYLVTRWLTVYPDGYVVDEEIDCTSDWPWACESTILEISADGADIDEYLRYDTWSCP